MQASLTLAFSSLSIGKESSSTTLGGDTFARGTGEKTTLTPQTSLASGTGNTVARALGGARKRGNVWFLVVTWLSRELPQEGIGVPDRANGLASKRCVWQSAGARESKTRACLQGRDSTVEEETAQLRETSPF